MKRHRDRFPQVELDQARNEVPSVPPDVVNQLDGAAVVRALARVDELYQAPLALFYLEDHSYKEIADILGIPIGTVQSRISRGRAQLQRILLDPATNTKTRTRNQHRG
jgi:RNA polymerase sigma factor (sigma-70 family)